MEPEIINPTSFLSEFSKSQKTIDTKDELPYEFDQGMGELNQYDVGLTPYIPKEENRAQNQNWWQSTRNSLSQLVSGTIGEIVATPGYIAGRFEPVEEMDKGISGLFIEAGEWIKQQGQEFAPLYQSQASREKIFAPWDSEWMAQTIADFGPTVALVASAFLTEGLTLPRLLSLFRQIPGISKYARAAQIFKNGSKIYKKLRTVNTTLFSRMAENGMEAYQTFNEVYDGLKSSNPEMSDEDMRKLAGEAGSKVWRENWALIALDYVQFDGLLNGFGKLGKTIGLGQQMASEALEEGLQYTMQAEAKNEIDFKTGKADRDKTFVETFIEGLTDPEMQKAMVQGALGGAVFQGMGAITNKIGERYRQPLSQSTSEVVNDIVKRGYADVAKANIDKKIAETDDPKLKKHLEGVKASIDKAVEVHQSENPNKDETAKALIKTQVLNNEKTDIEQKIDNKKSDTTIQNKSAVDYAKASLASPHLNTLRKKYSKFPKVLSIIDKLEQKYNNQRDTLASPEVTDEATHLIPQMKVDVHKAVELELEEEIQKQVATDLAEGNRELHDNLVKEDVKVHISNYTDKEELLKLRESETDAENKKVIDSRIEELWQSESKVFPTIEQGADVWAEHYRENLFTFKNDAKNLFKQPNLTIEDFKNKFEEFKPLLEERQKSGVADQKRAISLEEKDKTKIIDIVGKDEKGLTIKQINQRTGKQDRTNLVEQLVNEGLLIREGKRYKKVEVEDDVPIIVEHSKEEPQPDDIPFDPQWARSNDMLFYAATEVDGKWYINYGNKVMPIEEYEKLGFDKPTLKTGWYPVTKDKEPVKWHQTDVDVEFLRKVYEITGKPLDQHEVHIKVDWNYTNGNWKNRDANKDNFKIYYVIKHDGKEHIIGEVPAYKSGMEEELKSFRYTLYEHAKQEENDYEYPHTLKVKATRPGRVWNTKSRNSDLTISDRGTNLGVYSDGKIYGIEQTDLDRANREDIKSFEGKLTEGAVYWFITHPVTGKIVPIRLFTRKVKDLPNVEKKIKHILAGVNKDNWVDKRREVSRYVKWGTKEKRQPDFGFNKSGELIVNGEVTPIPDGAVIQDVIYDTLDIGDRTIQVDTRRINTKGYNEMLMNEGYIQTDVNQINPFHSPKFKVDYTELKQVELKEQVSVQEAAVSKKANLESKKADIERRRKEELKQVKPLSFSDNEIKQKQENQQKRVDDAKEIISFGKTFSEALDNIIKRQEELNNTLNKRQKEETKDREVHQYTKEELESQPEYQEIKRLDKLINSINEVYTEGESENFKNSTQEALDFENKELEAIPSKRKRNNEEIGKIHAKYDAELKALENNATNEIAQPEQAQETTQGQTIETNVQPEQGATTTEQGVSSDIEAKKADIERRRQELGLQRVLNMFPPDQSGGYRVIVKGDKYEALLQFTGKKWDIYPKQKNGEFQASDPATGEALLINRGQGRKLAEKYLPIELVNLMEEADSIKGVDNQQKFEKGKIKEYVSLFRKEWLESQLPIEKERLEYYKSDEYPNKDSQARIVKAQEEIIAKYDAELAASNEIIPQESETALPEDILQQISNNALFKLESQHYTTKLWNQKEGQKWLKDKFGEEAIVLSQEELNDLADRLGYVAQRGGKNLWGFVHQGMVYMSELAPESVHRHEAYHLIHNYVLTDSERRAIEKFGTEEEIADAFMEYMQTEDAPYAAWKRVFKKIYLFFKRILALDKMTLDEFFWTFENSTYNSVSFKKNVEVFRPKVEEIHPTIKKQRIRLINKIFLTALGDLKKANPNLKTEDLFRLALGKEDLYGTKVMDRLNEMEVNIDNNWKSGFYEDIKLDNGTVIPAEQIYRARKAQIKQLKDNLYKDGKPQQWYYDAVEDLRRYGVFVNTIGGKDVIEGEEDGLETWMKENVKSPAFDSFTFNLKVMLTDIPDAEYVSAADRDKPHVKEYRLGNKTVYIKTKRDSFNQTIYMDGDEIYAKLLQHLSDSLSQEDMMNKLEDMSYDYPWAKILYDDLSSENGDYLSGNLNQLKSEMYYRFAQWANTQSIVITPVDGKFRLGYSNEKTLKSNLIREWWDKVNSPSNPLFENKEKQAQTISVLNKLNVSPNSSQKDVAAIVKTMNAVGIETTDEIVKAIVKENKGQSLQKALVQVVEGNKKGVEVIANLIKKFYPEYYQPSYVNVEGEKVQNHIRASFMSRQIEKFNRSEGMEVYEGDPFYNSAYDESVQNVEDALWLDRFKTKKGIISFNLVDGFGGVSSKTFADFTPLEFLAYQMGAFYNNGNHKVKSNSENGQAYYSVQLFADSSSHSLIGMETYSKKDILTKLTQVAFNEYDAIQEGANGVKGYKPKFNFFPFFNNLSESELESTFSSRESVKKMIEKNVAEWIKRERRTLVEKGFFNKTKDQYDFLDNRIDNVNEFLEDFYWNDIYAQTQIISLFYGNLSYYNKINNFYKRAKEIWAPGDFLDTTRINKEYFMAIVPDSETTNQEVVDFVNKHLEGVGVRYENSSETDGQGVIDIDRWREIQLGKGADLDWVNGIYDRVAQGVETETDMEYIFMPYKPFMYDLVKHNGQVVPLQVKNSEVVLLPSMAKNNPKLQTILDKLKEVRDKTGLNGSLQFDTTVKVGEHNSNKSVETIDNWITLKNSEYRIQGETPEHQVDADNLLGTQLRKIATGDLELDGDYHVGEESIKGKAIKEEMNSILKADVEANAKSLRERFKSKEEFYKSLQEEAISRKYPKKIIDALEPIVKPDGTVGTKLPLYHPLLIKKAFALIASLYRNKITKLKFPGASLPNVTSYGLERKPQVVFNEDGSIQHLECYMPMTNRWLRDYMDKNGFLNVDKLAEFGLDLGVAYRIPTEGKYSMVPIKVIGFTNAGIILPPEITKMTGLDFDIDKMYVMLYSFDVVGGKPIRTKWYTEGSFDAYKQYLKERANKESKEHMYKISQNERERIEEELDAMWESHFNEYKEITSPVFKSKLKELKSKLKDSNVGHTIDALYEENSPLMKVIPKEMKTSYANVKERLNEEKVYGIERTEEFVKLIVQFKEKTQSPRVQATLDQILINLETILMLQGIQQEHIKSFVERSKVAFKEGLIKSADEKLSPIRTSVWDSFEKKHYGFLAKFNNEISFEDFENAFSPFQHNTKKARDNRKLDLLRAVLTSPYTFKSQMDGGNFDALEKLAHEVGGEFPNVNPLLASERSRVFENMMAGKALIGIGANYVATHQLMQDQNIELVEPLEFDGRVASDLGAKYVTGTNDIVTAALAQFNASFVDNGKNPLAGLYNMNTYTADVAMLFTKLFGWEAAVRFISHPYVKNFYTRYINAGGDFRAEQKIIDEIFPQVRFTGEKRRKPLPLTMDMLVNKTDGQDVLYAFIYYKKNQAKQLGDLVTAMKVADAGMSSTVEDTLVSLDAIEKAKKNDGIGGVVQYFENESLHTTSMVNLGIIEPLDRLRDELEFPDYRQGAYKEIRERFNDEKESGKLNAKEIRFIHDVMINFMASSFDMFKFNRKAMVKSILPIIEKAKKDNPDNSSKYRKLLSSIKTSASREDSGLQILKLDNGISYNAENDIMEQWEMMFSDSSLIPETDITYSRLAKALVKYAFITKGFRFGPGSFSQVTPINFYAELKNENNVSFTDFIGGMIRLANSDSQSMNNFVNQIIRNYFPRLSFVRIVNTERDVIKKDNEDNIITVLANEIYAKNGVFPSFVKYKDDNKKWHLFQNEFENKYVPVTALGLYNEVEEWDSANSNPSSDFRQNISKDIVKETKKISSDYKPVATVTVESKTKDVDLHNIYSQLGNKTQSEKESLGSMEVPDCVKK